jgi:putative nucleotidyltransferase with HDIG domain
MADWPTREEAQAVLDEWTKNVNLKKHAYAVEAAMRAYAEKLGEDSDRWGVVGLLHDFDYERFPSLEEHPFRGVEFLRERGMPEELVEGVLAHAEHTGVERDTPMKKAIFAVDELTGLIVAVALVRPSKKLADVSVEAVLKKWGEKRFAAGVNRQLIEQGAEELGVPLDEHIATVLTAMQGCADKLSL